MIEASGVGLAGPHNRKAETMAKKPSFRTSQVQVWHDPWRNTDRTLRFDGCCVGCGVRTYSFDDGENDPRGILGRHAASTVCAVDEGPEWEGPDVPACFECMNDEPRYRHVVERARKRWHRRTGEEVTA